MDITTFSPSDIMGPGHGQWLLKLAGERLMEHFIMNESG